MIVRALFFMGVNVLGGIYICKEMKRQCHIHKPYKHYLYGNCRYTRQCYYCEAFFTSSRLSFLHAKVCGLFILP